VANVQWDGLGNVSVVPARVVYQQDFNTGADWWLTATGGDYGGYGGPQVTHVLDWNAAGYVTSWSAPTDHLWFTDGNHACSSPFYTLTGAPPCTFWKAMTMWKRVDGENGTPILPPLDMNGATLTVTLRGNTSHPNPNLYFLALGSYTDSTGRHGVEYWDEVHPMPLLPDWHTYSFVLRPENFRCLGGATWPTGSARDLIDRNDMYNCNLSAAQVLANMNADFELILTDINPQHQATGRVDLDFISLVK
jgi:hypothetical protein